MSYDVVAFVLVALVALSAAAALARGRTWYLPALLLAAVALRVVGAELRHVIIFRYYKGFGDAVLYFENGQRLLERHGLLGLFDLQVWFGGPSWWGTRFLNKVTALVAGVTGPSLRAEFLVFSLLAFAGLYLAAAAFRNVGPQPQVRQVTMALWLWPSLWFWPSSIGKEALMQLGIGTVALGAAHLLRQRLLVGLAVGLAGGWVLWVVRPHLLALVTVAAGCAYLAGRVRAGPRGATGLIGRPVGLLVVVLLMAFTVSQGADFLGIEELSLSSIEAELDEQTERSAQGGSQFDNGDNSLNPINLPRGAVTVLLRPFPWETDSPLQLLASLESVLLAGLIVARLSSVREALVRARATPFLLYGWVLTILYAATFSSFANFGLLVRQRSLVLPALFVLLALEPARRRTPPPPPIPTPPSEPLHAVR
jgi:hypothetical protein